MIYQRLPFVAILMTGLVTSVVLAQDTNNRILYPAIANLTFNYLDTVDVAFVTNYTSPWLYHFCFDFNGLRQQINYYSPSDVAGRAYVSVQLTVATEFVGTTCWFDLCPREVESTTELLGVNSSTFNFNKEAASKQTTFALSSTSSVVNSSTKTTLVTSSTSSTIFTTPTTSPTGSLSSSSATNSQSSIPSSVLSTSQSSTPSGGFSTGASVGVGISISLVGIGLAALAAWYFMRRRRAAKQSALSASSIDSKSMKTGPFELSQDPYHHELYSGHIGEPSWRLYEGVHELPVGQ